MVNLETKWASTTKSRFRFRLGDARWPAEDQPEPVELIVES